MRSRRETNTEETIAALVEAGRARFGQYGYDQVSLEDIAKDARVTTGAVYHHFDGKKGLFLAVAEQIEAELMGLAKEVTDTDPWQQMLKAFEVLIDAFATSEVQRIIFLDAPRVIGPEAWREVELKYAYGAMSSGIAMFIQAGILRPYPIELLAPVLLAVMVEGSRMVAADPTKRGDAIELMGLVLNSLRN